MEDVERLFRELVRELADEHPDRLTEPLQISEIYQSVLPYRHFRTALGVETNEDYEMTLLRFLAGDGGYATVDPSEVQDALALEAQSINPNPGAFREYAAAKVYLNGAAVRGVTQTHEAYAPPPEPEPAVSMFDFGDSVSEPAPAEDDDAFGDPFGDERSPKPDATVLELAQAETAPVEAVPDFEPDRAAAGDEAAADAIPTACFACGEALPTTREVRFCPFCGHSMSAFECPGCGTELEARWRFCITCGQPQDPNA